MHILLLAFLIMFPLNSYHGHPVIVTYSNLGNDKEAMNSSFTDYFQWARWGFLQERGFNRERLTSLRSLPFAKEIRIKFYKPAFYDQQLNVTVRVMQVRKVTYTIHQEIWRFDNLLAEADVEIINYDPINQEPRLIPEELKETLLQR